MTGFDRESALEFLLGHDRKVLRGYDHEALVRRMEELHEGAEHPWKGIAAYRLAHLRMRTASTNEDLEDVDALLQEASRVVGLGAWPSVFRLAVLHRLGAAEGLSAAPFARALELADDTTPGTDPTLQNAIINALELFQYTTGQPYDERLAYRGVLPLGDERQRASGWYLISRGVEGMTNISRFSLATYKLAREEVDTLGELHPQALIFEVPALGAGQRDDGRIWKLGSSPCNAGQDQLREIVKYFWALETSPDDETNANTRRQRRKRLRDSLVARGMLSSSQELRDVPFIGIVEEVRYPR